MKTAVIKKIMRVLLFLLLPLTLYPLPSAFSADWQIRFDISVPFMYGEGGKAMQTLVAGTRLTALDGFDNSLDTVALGGVTLSAYFYQPTFPPAYQFLVRDFRFDALPKQWDFYLLTDQDGQPVTLTWELPSASVGTCLGAEFAMTDVTGGVAVDLTQLSSMYTASSGVPRQFQLNAVQVVESPPAAPVNLFSPRTGTASVLLAWSPASNGITGYHVYRKDPGATQYQRLTVAPTPVAKYLDQGLSPGSYSYEVTAVTAGCQSELSNELAVTVGP